MKVLIELHPTEVKEIVAFLNDDNGLRNAVADKLIPQNKPENVEKWANIVVGLAAISRGLTLALEANDAPMSYSNKA